MNWTLYELLERVNESTVITLFRAEDGCEIGTYDWRPDIPDELTDCEVTDIFVDPRSGADHVLCIEIETGEESDNYDN